MCWTPCISSWKFKQVLELCQFALVRCACAFNLKEPGQLLLLLFTWYSCYKSQSCILTLVIYWKSVNLLNICGRESLLNWASLWCRTCKNWRQWQPAFQGGVYDSDGTLGRQRYLCNHAPIDFSLLSQAIHRDHSNFKKRREKYGKSKIERERERVQRRGHEECFCCPERLSPVSAVKKCYWWRVQMLKEGMIANKRGQKTRVGSAVTAALLLCVFTTTMSATLSKPLLYFNFSVHYKHNHWGMMLQWRALSHSTSPVQSTVRHWDASLNWLQRFWCSCDWSCAVLGCFLAALDGRMIDEDYQVLLSDGQAFAQLWVLGSEHPPAGGKQKISHCFLELCCRNTDRFYRPRV